MEKEDVKVHYYITKKSEDSLKSIDAVINIVIAYVQNHEIYFAYDMGFVDCVLVFGIIGYESDHRRFQKLVGKDLDKLGCVLHHYKIKE